MRVLICFDSKEEAQKLQMGREMVSKLIHGGTGHLEHIPFHCHQFEGMQVDWLCLNKNVFDAQFRLMQVLQLNRYHLILHLGLCVAVGDYLRPGDVVNIIQEKPGSFQWEGETFLNGFESGAFEKDLFPQQRGGYINMTNSYFNVFVDFEKVAGVTLPFEHIKDFEGIVKRLQASVVTTNGMAVAYSCLASKQPFYQIAVVRENRTAGTRDELYAMDQLCLVTDYILDKIK